MNEDLVGPEPPPEKVVSLHRNLVTAVGLAQMNAKLAELTRPLAVAGPDMTAVIERDLRYWRARRATAEIGPGPDDSEEIGFGSTITINRDGKTETLQIVGEDEAEPANSKLSWASPLAQALYGLGEGDTVEFGGRKTEIMAVGK